jgi:hypothetical protein
MLSGEVPFARLKAQRSLPTETTTLAIAFINLIYFNKTRIKHDHAWLGEVAQY